MPTMFSTTPIVGAEYRFGDGAGLEQGEAEQHRVAQHHPDGSNGIVTDRNALHQYRIDPDADHNKKALESQGKQRAQIALTDLALLPVSKVENGMGPDW